MILQDANVNQAGIDSKTILSAVAIIVSVFTFAVTTWFNRHSTIASKRPVLVFVYEGDKGWEIRNIGGGPALNVIVAHKKVGGEWLNPVRIPPLAKDREFSLEWLGHVNTTGLGATYTDFENRPYTSTCGNDLSTTKSGTLFGPWAESQVGRHWNHPSYEE